MIPPTPRLNALFNKSQLAAEIGVPEELVIRRAFETPQQHLYSTSVIPKRCGQARLIHAPYWPLMNMQRGILRLLEEIYRPSPRAMGFVKRRGIRLNASLHVGKRLILNIDLEDYFPSIHFGRVRGRLMAAPYNLSDDVATTISKLCTLDGSLPIGAPTSPILANIVSSSLDGELTRIARENGCFYTRYADDITISTNRKNFPPSIASRSTVGAVQLGEALVNAVTQNGFQINNSKTRILTKQDSQEVCGVIVNKRLNPRRSILREVRGTIHAWQKFGREAAEAVWRQKHNWRGATSLESSLRGKIEHIIHIRGQNDESTALLVSRFNSLSGRNHRDIEYQYTGDPRDRLAESICLIEAGNEEAMIWKQGSGFVIPGGAIVTNFHNISDDGKIFPKIEAIFPSKNDFRYEMQIVYSDRDKDVVVLRTLDEAWRPFLETLAVPLSFAEPEVGSIIYVGGFPSYTVGDSYTVLSGEVVGTSVANGQRYFRVSQVIVKGNSGGPAFDTLGQVVGIATRGVDTEDVMNVAFNGCIPVHTIDRIFLGG